MDRPLLPPAAARTLYNAADALLPPPEGAVGLDWAPGVEAVLRRRGAGAARRLRWLLRRLEWHARLRGAAGGFSKLPRDARTALLAARPDDRGWLLALLAEAAQSASGA